jgi:hypothetical protein
MRMMAGRVDKPLQVFYRNQSNTREITFPSNFWASPTKLNLKTQNRIQLYAVKCQVPTNGRGKTLYRRQSKNPRNIRPKILKFE